MKKRLTIIGAAIAALMLAATAAFATHVFSDVSDDSTHADAIHWAADNGLVQGYPDGTFRPENAVERQHAAAMFRRYDEIVNDKIDDVVGDDVEGERGPAGPAGPAGPQGPKGDTGAAGANGQDGRDGVSGHEPLNAEARWGNSTGNSGTVALCPEGKVATGGGYEIDGTANGDATLVSITANGPVYEDGQAVGWRVLGDHAGQEVNVKAWTVCATMN